MILSTILILMNLIYLKIARSQVQLELPASYVVDIQYLIGGSKPDQQGIYGTKGEFSTQNRPGSRYSHSMCTNPLNGNILVFGGSGYDRSKDSLGGSDTVNQPGYYGQLNVAAPENVPGARQGHSMVSDQSRKSVWIFGGAFAGYYDDLWEWQSESGLWIWRSGTGRISQPVVYESNPQKGILASPGGRLGHAMVIHHGTGTLVLFGGNGLNEAGTWDFFNDLWYFRLPDFQWSSVSRGGFVNDDIPTKRYHHSLSMNQHKNSIFMFGGAQYSNDQLCNDLWVWNMKQQKWFRLQEAPSINQKGFYRNFSGGSRPGARYGHSMSIHEDTGQLALLGGYGYDSDGLLGCLNDLWIYEPLTGWIWVGGNDTVDANGMYQKPFRIGSRRWHSAVSSQDQNFFYFFGGDTSSGRLNDLWNINISITCPVASAKYGLNCIPCQAGTVVNGDSCTTCPKGYFSTNPADSACTPCPKNQYQPFKGQTTCLDCPINAVCTLTEFQCNVGFTANVNSLECIPCLSGFWKPGIGNQKCTQCLNHAMICEPTRCLLHNGRMCPLNTVYNFWIDNPSIGLIILSAIFWNLFFVGFWTGFKEPWFYSHKTGNSSKSKSSTVSLSIQELSSASDAGFLSLVVPSESHGVCEPFA